MCTASPDSPTLSLRRTLQQIDEFYGHLDSQEHTLRSHASPTILPVLHDNTLTLHRALQWGSDTPGRLRRETRTRDHSGVRLKWLRSSLSNSMTRGLSPVEIAKDASGFYLGPPHGVVMDYVDGQYLEALEVRAVSQIIAVGRTSGSSKGALLSLQFPESLNAFIEKSVGSCSETPLLVYPRLL